MWISKGKAITFLHSDRIHEIFHGIGIDCLASRIPDDLAYELVWIVIATGDRPSIFIPDVIVVVDSGIHEIESYEPTTGVLYVQEEVILESY
jgi:hypothetical protein